MPRTQMRGAPGLSLTAVKTSAYTRRASRQIAQTGRLPSLLVGASRNAQVTWLDFRGGLPQWCRPVCQPSTVAERASDNRSSAASTVETQGMITKVTSFAALQIWALSCSRPVN
jgi:hypothetical protein